MVPWVEVLFRCEHCVRNTPVASCHLPNSFVECLFVGQRVLQLQDSVHEGGGLQQDDLPQVRGHHVLPMQVAGQGNSWLILPSLSLSLSVQMELTGARRSMLVLT